MANQALNQVPEVQESIINNVKCFLAVMNDGSIQQMSKELMAQVLEGLLPIASTEKKGLKPEYEVNILNIDIAMTESGKYTKITSKSSNVTLIWKRTQYNGIPEIIFISRGNYSSISSGIATRLNNKYLTKPNIYVDISGALYLQVDYSNYAQNCIFNLLGSSPISNEGEVELPSDATRIEVNDII